MEIFGNTLEETWQKSIEYLLEYGEWVPTERNTRALEAKNMLMVVNTPQLNPPLPARYAFDRKFVAEHIGTFHTEQYTGNSIRSRLYKYGGVFDQIDAAVVRLRDNWYSRRAVVSTWEPLVDSTSEGPPCAVVLNFFIRDGALHLTATFRSNDAWLAIVPDMIALMQIQFEVASKLGISVGDYTHLAISYHIYEPDIADARKRTNGGANYDGNA